MSELNLQAKVAVQKEVERTLSKIAAVFGIANLLVLAGAIWFVWKSVDQHTETLYAQNDASLRSLSNKVADGISKDINNKISGSISALESARDVALRFSGEIVAKRQQVENLDIRIEKVTKSLESLESQENIEAAAAFFEAWEGEKDTTDVLNMVHGKVAMNGNATCVKPRIYAGQTDPENTSWEPYREDNSAALLLVDTSAAQFEDTPWYFVSLNGDGGHWAAHGADAIYSPTTNSFQIYVRWAPESTRDIVNYAQDTNWHVRWLAIGC